MSVTLSMIFMLFDQDLYNNIKKEPFKIPEDDGNDLMHTFFNPVKEGWLCKQGTGVSLHRCTVYNFCPSAAAKCCRSIL